MDDFFLFTLYNNQANLRSPIHFCQNRSILSIFNQSRVIKNESIFPMKSLKKFAGCIATLTILTASINLCARTKKQKDFLENAQKGNLPALKKSLASKSMDINFNDDGISALMYAAHAGHLKTVQWLVENGADINARYPFLDYSKSINLLKRERPNPPRKCLGDTALIHALKGHKNEIANWLIDHGADINLSNGLGLTPLAIALMNNNITMTQKLIALGAPCNVRDEDGLTILMHAVITGNIDLVRIIVQCGADVNASTTDHATAISIPTQVIALTQGRFLYQQYYDILKFLVENGATINKQNPECDGIANIARFNNDIYLLAWLNKHNIDINNCCPQADNDDSCVITLSPKKPNSHNSSEIILSSKQEKLLNAWLNDNIGLDICTLANNNLKPTDITISAAQKKLLLEFLASNEFQNSI